MGAEVEWVREPSPESDESGRGDLNPNESVWRREGHPVPNPRRQPQTSNLMIMVRKLAPKRKEFFKDYISRRLSARLLAVLQVVYGRLREGYCLLLMSTDIEIANQWIASKSPTSSRAAYFFSFLYRYFFVAISWVALDKIPTRR